jgi:hypothetical protein
MAEEIPEESPYRFPALNEARFEAKLARQRAEGAHASARGHGFPEKVRHNPDGSVDETYADGHVEHYSAQEVTAADARAAARDADELLVHGPPAESLADAVRVTHVPVPWDMPSVAQDELLEGAGTLLDHLDDLGEDACDELCRLLNEHGASRWGMLPLFEVYQTPESWETRRVLGYRLNALEAVVLPRAPTDYEAGYDEDERSLMWSSEEGIDQLDRITEILTDGSDESVDETQLLCERGPTMGFYLVRNGRVYDLQDWKPLYQSLEDGKGKLIHPVPQVVTPLLRALPYSVVEAVTVASLMEEARAAMHHDENEAAREGDAILSDEIIAAMERLAVHESLGSLQLDRIRRQRQGRDRVQEVWAALKEARSNGRALLPAWKYTEARDQDLLLVQDYEALEEQMRHYQATNIELELALEPRQGSFGAEPWEPADPSPGHRVFTRFDRNAWKNPAYWWTHARRRELDALRGQWVALDEFQQVLASGPDPEPLRATAGWRHIVSVPASGYDEGLVITNPAIAAD